MIWVFFVLVFGLGFGNGDGGFVCFDGFGGC